MFPDYLSVSYDYDIGKLYNKRISSLKQQHHTKIKTKISRENSMLSELLFFAALKVSTLCLRITFPGYFSMSQALHRSFLDPWRPLLLALNSNLTFLLLLIFKLSFTSSAQSIRLPIVHFCLLCSICVTYGTPCCTSVTRCFPTSSPVR